MAKAEAAAIAAPMKPLRMVGKVRNPEEEARLRSILMLGMQNATFVSMLTKSKDDDKACKRINRALYDPMRWSVLAEIFFDDEEA
jgi:hypothetical protein